MAREGEKGEERRKGKRKVKGNEEKVVGTLAGRKKNSNKQRNGQKQRRPGSINNGQMQDERASVQEREGGQSKGHGKRRNK
ncbi:hypothetical protein DOS74_02305 [Staphylococcus felis]|nr:hypothetical protein DOS74_02305 [Staphylococcus felis]